MYKPEVQKGFLRIELYPVERKFDIFDKVGTLVATRTRLGIFDPRSKISYNWFYSDIKKYEIMEFLSAVRLFTKTQFFLIKFKIPKAGLIDFAMMHSNDSAVRGATVMNARTKHENKATFLQILDRFFADLVAVE